MSDTKLAPFYYPWPNLGIKLSRQWENLRDNTEKEAPLIRAAYVDAQPVSANAPGEHDLAGWAIGERDFRNKFRIWYDKVADRFSIQYNSGTEPVEIWNDYLSIRDIDGRVTVHGYGGLDATAGGFYTPLSRNLAVSATFSPPSAEWQWTHSLNAKPILWNTFNLEDKSITPISVDVSNPNIAYFYFSQPYAGRAIAGAEHLRGSGIRITDGISNFVNATILSFNDTDFYISHGLEGYPTINLKTITGTGGVTDHGLLTGLADDDHPQYLLRTEESPGFYGVFIRESDGNPPTFRNDTVIFDSEFFYIHSDSVGKPTVSLRDATGSGADHGSLTGLSDDDHTQYLLASQATDRATFTTNWTDLTDGGVTTLHSHADSSGSNFYAKMESGAEFGDTILFADADFNKSGPTLTIDDTGIDHAQLANLLIGDPHTQYVLKTDQNPGFYGIYIRESDGNPPTFRNDTIIFDSEFFYLNSNSVGKPTVSFRGIAPFGSTALAQGFGTLGEWIFQHNLNTENLVWSTYDNRQLAIIPDKVDISNPNIAYFYFIPAIAGKAVLLGGLNTAGSVALASGITSVTDGYSTYNNQVKLNFSNRDFYLSPGGQAGSSVVNLSSRYTDYISAFIETASVMNINIDPMAPYDYRLNFAKIDCREGSCKGGFYLLRNDDRVSATVWKGHSTGIGINNMSHITISTTRQTLTPGSAIDVKTGDSIIFSVSENTAAAKWIRISVETERL